MYTYTGEDDGIRTEELVTKLVDMLLLLKTGRELRHLLSSLLTPTELKQVAYRLEIASLLKQGYTQRKIMYTVGVAIATVNCVNKALQQGKYKCI